MAAVNIYLNIDGITGESTASRFAGQIECQSVAFEDSVSIITSAGLGSSAGKVTFGPIVFTKSVDTTSPQILVALASGKHFPTATFSFVKAGEKAVTFASIVLKQVFFTVQDVNIANGLTLETVKMNFAGVQLNVSSQKPDGSLNPPVQGGWDLLQNKPWSGV